MAHPIPIYYHCSCLRQKLTPTSARYQGVFTPETRTKAPCMETTYQEIQASLKLSHVVSSSVEKILQPHLKYYSVFSAVSLPWLVSQS